MRKKIDDDFLVRLEGRDNNYQAFVEAFREVRRARRCVRENQGSWESKDALSEALCELIPKIELLIEDIAADLTDAEFEGLAEYLLKLLVKKDLVFDSGVNQV